MLDIKFIRENPDIIKEGCQKKQVKVDIDLLLKIDKTLLQYRKEYESWRAVLNQLSKSKPDKKTIEKAKGLKFKIKSRETAIADLREKFQGLMFQIPNLPQEDIPFGRDEKDNVVLKEVGKKTKFNFKPKNYLEIAQNLDLIDIERAAKISGTRFGFIKKEAAILEFALINLAFDTLTKQEFTPLIPPVMIKPEMAKAMGYPEQFDGKEAYYIEKDNLYLVGTSEQSMGAMHASEIFEEKNLPQRYVGFSTCFRKEAGAYGKDTKGIFRVHQFDKVEMFSFCHPTKSKQEHKFLLQLEEKLMQRLSIPYRLVQISTGDLGFPVAAKYDIEAWMPSEGRYRETHSTSNCTDFQARRLNIRYRDSKTKKLEFVHTLNGTAFAVGRTLIAIIENYQQKDGSIKIPKALQKYLKFKVIK